MDHCACLLINISLLFQQMFVIVKCFIESNPEDIDLIFLAAREKETTVKFDSSFVHLALV